MPILSELFAKIARTETLTPLELDQFRIEIAALEILSNVVSGWVESGTKTPRLFKPVIHHPDFKTSPLYVFHCYMTTDQTITVDTWEALTFDSSTGDTTVFDFWQNDKSKIRIDKTQLNITLDGIIDWAPNTTNDRVVRMRIFDAADSEIASREISNMPTSNSAGFGLKQVFSYTEDVRGIFPSVAYMQLEVRQNGAATLDVENAVLSLRIA